MMMKMLEAGGMAPFIDEIRQADKDNPKGYYEYEKVKDLAKDSSWLPEAKGKVIKIISYLLPHLPEDLDYKIIFMRRNTEEILASQQKMLARSGKPPGAVSDAVMAAKFSIHLRKIQKYIAQHKNISVLYLNYAETITDPAKQATKINFFFDGALDTTKMTAVVDKNLYRQRATADERDQPQVKG